MQKYFLKWGAWAAALAVVLGAFGAHALKGIFLPEDLQVFETGVRYQFYHALALIFAGILYKEFPGIKLIWSGRLFIAGIILFSGSLYALVCCQYYFHSVRWIGAITPVGGLAFIAGWISMAWAITGKAGD